MSSGEKVFYSSILAIGGLAGEHQELTESDFTATAGAAYIPPENGVFRRIVESRTIQLLKNSPISITTCHSTADVTLRLPCGLIISNDALDGRLIYIKNLSSTYNVSIEKYEGTVLIDLAPNLHVLLLHKENDTWDVFTKAENIPFDSDGTVFPLTITDVQTAIEYAKQNAEGFPRAGIRGIYNGTVSNNNWLGPNELLPNTPFAVFPVNTKLNEITWSNQTSDVAFRIQFRKGSKTGAVFYTLTVTSPNPGYGYVAGLTETFVPGDVIYAQYLDDGQNCSDMDLMIWISRIV